VCIGPEGAEADFLEDFSCWLPPRSVRDHSIELPAVIFKKGSAFAGLRFCGGTQGTSINVMKASATYVGYAKIVGLLSCGSLSCVCPVSPFYPKDC